MQPVVTETETGGRQFDVMRQDTLWTRFEVEPVDAVQWQVRVEVPSPRLEAARASVLRQLAKTSRLPGFRPGKAPMREIEARYGRSAQADALEKTINETMGEALRLEGLQASVHYTVPKLDGEPPASLGGTLRYAFTVEVFPTVTLPELGSLTAEVERVEITPTEVDARLEALRREHVTLVPVEDRQVVARGDLVDVRVRDMEKDPDRSEDAEPMTLKIAEEGELDEVAQAVLGQSIGETLALAYTVPDSPQTQAMAGRVLQLEITIAALRQEQLPELDDAFAQTLDRGDSLAELRTSVEEELRAAKSTTMEDRARARFMAKVVAEAGLSLPPAFVREQASGEARRMLQQYLGPQADKFPLSDEMVEGFVGRVEQELRQELWLMAVADHFEVQVGDTELEGWFQNRAAETGEPVARVKARVRDPQQLRNVMANLRLRAAMDRLWAAIGRTEIDPIPEAPAAEEEAGSAAESEG
jgi:trigger factor